MLLPIILGFAAFLISLVGSRLVIRTLAKNRAPDLQVVMGKAAPAPVANAGIGLVFALIIALLGADMDYTIILCLFMLAGGGLLKNHAHASPVLLFFIEVISVSLALVTLHAPVFGGLLPPAFDHVVALGLWLGLIHMFGRLEVAQGVAVTQSITIGFGLCLMLAMLGEFPSELATITLIIGAAGFGAMWWNWPPAKMLLGYIGSAPLGFITGYALLIAASQNYGIPALILVAYIMCEGIMILYKSLTNKDNKKILPVCAEAILPQEKDLRTRYIAGINMLLVLLAVLSSLDPVMALFNLAAAYVMVFGFLWFCSSKAPA